MPADRDLFERAKVHIDRNETDQAIGALTAYLNTDFWNPDAAMMLGSCHILKGNHGLGAVLSKQAAQTKPDVPDGWRNLGVAFKCEHKNAEAIECWSRALKLETKPSERAKTLASLGTGYINEGMPEKGLPYFDEAVAISPDDPQFTYNRSLVLLEMGRWEQGFREYNDRFRCGAQVNRHYGLLPIWDGSPGKRVIVWGEQGIGDEILFASCLGDLIAISEKVIFDCHSRLTKLFARSFPAAEIYGTRKVMSGVPWFDDSKADAHISISSLPMHFRKRDADFPGKPFLKAEPSMIRNSDRPRIGISWQGGTHKTRMQDRTISLDQWLPIFNAIDADFYSLQYTQGAAREVLLLEEKAGIKMRHLPGAVEAKDYDQTASLVASLDLVITVPTAVYHLSNALGVETWTLVPARPAWTFATNGENWFRDTVKFYRQKGDKWGRVIKDIAADLRAKFPSAALADAA